MPCVRSAGRASRSRICACVVTSSAVVGSSAIRMRGAHDSAMRDHRALAQAAAQLERVLVDAALRLAGCPPGASISIARSPRLRLVQRRCSRIVSIIWLPTVWTGLNDVIGSWKTSADLAAADRRASAGPSRVEPRPGRSTVAVRPSGRSRISPAHDAARPLDDAEDRARGHALAAAALADDAERAARVHVEARAVHRLAPSPRPGRNRSRGRAPRGWAGCDAHGRGAGAATGHRGRRHRAARRPGS